MPCNSSLARATCFDGHRGESGPCCNAASHRQTQRSPHRWLCRVRAQVWRYELRVPVLPVLRAGRDDDALAASSGAEASFCATPGRLQQRVTRCYLKAYAGRI